jgi:ribosomal RNA methyltransferase Nop2
MSRGVSLDPVADWTKVGLKIYESRVPIGATPEYLAGHYILQSASSLLPVMALSPQPGEKVLDMAAAPGGKTTHICQLMKNSGVVFANDAKKERLRALQFNLQRLGCTNAVVINYDGRKIPEHLQGFDRVLLDAPCTGLGIIAKDHSIKASKQMIDIYKHAHLQKELVLAGLDCLKPGGVLVYSTCSISPLENEAVVAYALAKRKVELVDAGLGVGEPGLTKYQDKRWPESMKFAQRIYPHTHNMDGFFYAKLVKKS